MEREKRGNGKGKKRRGGKKREKEKRRRRKGDDILPQHDVLDMPLLKAENRNGLYGKEQLPFMPTGWRTYRGGA